MSESMKDRLRKLEDEIHNTGPTESGVIEKIKQKVKSKEIKEHEANFLGSLKRIVEDGLDDFFETVLKTCEFIEIESDNLKKLFDLVPNGENKALLMVELLRKLYEHFTEEDEQNAQKLAKIYCSLSKGHTILNADKRLVKTEIEAKPSLIQRRKSVNKKKNTVKSKESGCIFI